jgi:hypothetical protein
MAAHSREWMKSEYLSNRNVRTMDVAISRVQERRRNEERLTP